MHISLAAHGDRVAESLRNRTQYPLCASVGVVLGLADCSRLALVEILNQHLAWQASGTLLSALSIRDRFRPGRGR